MSRPIGETFPQAGPALDRLAELLATDPAAPTSVRDPAEISRAHLADSLAGGSLPELAGAERIADLGAGAGLPGLVLAAALPGARVDLVESVRRKCRFMREAIAAMGIANAHVVCARSESWAGTGPPDGGRESYGAVVARAVGPLAALAELASPLLAEGGALVAWKGRRDRDEEEALRRTAEALAMHPERVLAVMPYPGSRERHLHVVRKSGPTPGYLPRRPGMARKRPLG